ncbi:MAG TPA: branched-chain amino acid ABC transporter permease [Candidatus Binatia bacterium]|nr:branched-chain amino acid ABC transporter permease [Candidatus Binatia bacterium]
MLINVLNGLSLAMVLFILAAGLTLAFGLMRIVNMAHGSYYLIGGYVGYTVIQHTGNYLTALVAAFVAVAVIGIFMQRFCLNQLYKDELRQALLTLGFLFIFADLAFWIWGGDPILLSEPARLRGAISLGASSYPVYRLFLIGCGLAVAVGLWLFIEKTKLGAIVRAGMDDEEMARGIGINMPLIFTLVFALGAGLAALGGVLGSPLLGLYPGVDFEVVLLAFVVVTVGGLGSVEGAFWGSLLIGLVDNFGNAWFPQLSLFTIFVPMVVVLALRPRGLMGRI